MRMRVERTSSLEREEDWRVEAFGEWKREGVTKTSVAREESYLRYQRG